MRPKRIRVFIIALAGFTVSLFFAATLGAQPIATIPPDINIPVPNSNTVKEVPLGSTSATPSSTTDPNNLDLQIAGNTNSSSGMNSDMDMMSMMSSMMGGMMGNMGNSGNMNNSGGMGMMGMMGGMGGMNNTSNMNNMPNTNANINGPILAQLQASNGTILQLISSLSNQPANANVQTQLNSLYQLLANHTAIIQMLLTNTGSTTAASSMSNMNNTSSMSSMGMM